MTGKCVTCGVLFEGSEESTNGPNVRCPECYKSEVLQNVEIPAEIKNRRECFICGGEATDRFNLLDSCRPCLQDAATMQEAINKVAHYGKITPEFLHEAVDQAAENAGTAGTMFAVSAAKRMAINLMKNYFAGLASALSSASPSKKN